MKSHVGDTGGSRETAWIKEPRTCISIFNNKEL